MQLFNRYFINSFDDFLVIADVYDIIDVYISDIFTCICDESFFISSLVKGLF